MLLTDTPLMRRAVCRDFREGDDIKPPNNAVRPYKSWTSMHCTIGFPSSLQTNRPMSNILPMKFVVTASHHALEAGGR